MYNNSNDGSLDCIIYASMQLYVQQVWCDYICQKFLPNICLFIDSVLTTANTEIAAYGNYAFASKQYLIICIVFSYF